MFQIGGQRLALLFIHHSGTSFFQSDKRRRVSLHQLVQPINRRHQTHLRTYITIKFRLRICFRINIKRIGHKHPRVHQKIAHGQAIAIVRITHLELQRETVVNFSFNMQHKQKDDE